jgi:hypothetical protein
LAFDSDQVAGSCEVAKEASRKRVLVFWVVAPVEVLLIRDVSKKSWTSTLKVKGPLFY